MTRIPWEWMVWSVLCDSVGLYKDYAGAVRIGQNSFGSGQDWSEIL